MNEPLEPPPGWGTDHLSAFLEAAYRNRYATFANKPEWYRRLSQIDDCFMTIFTGWLNPKDILAPLLFLRSHSAYRAACEHALAGQVADAFPQLRACLEYAAYGLHICYDLALSELWLRRHDDEDSKKKVRAEFTHGKLRSSIEKKNQHLAGIFDLLYDRTIDFGAHPNERSVTGSGAIIEGDGKKEFQQIYLHGDGMPLNHALKTTAQVGVCALEICQEAFGPRFELLGIRHRILELRKGL